MLSIAGEVRINSLATFSCGLLHMDTPVLADQQNLIIHNLCVYTGCHLVDLTKEMANRNKWCEKLKKNPCDWNALMMNDYIYIYVCEYICVCVYIYIYIYIYIILA